MSIEIVESKSFKNVCLTFSYVCSVCKKHTPVIIPYTGEGISIRQSCSCGKEFEVSMYFKERKSKTKKRMLLKIDVDLISKEK